MVIDLRDEGKKDSDKIEMTQQLTVFATDQANDYTKIRVKWELYLRFDGLKYVWRSM